MNKTNIEWTDYSWTIVNGCTRVSPGCGGPDGGGCYAERLAATRLRQHPKYEGLARMTDKGEARWTGVVRPWPDALDEPLRVRKPSRIFVADMGDLFHESVPDDFIDRVFAVMALCPQHTFQVLTKRPERMRSYMESRSRSAHYWKSACPVGRALEWKGISLVRFPLPNVHLGTSVEDQLRADERIPHLLATPAAVRFLSLEPLLGPVDLARSTGCPGLGCSHEFCDPFEIDWLIIGGESGPGARPCDIRDVRSLVQQGREAQVATFVKQLGSYVVSSEAHLPDWPTGKWRGDPATGLGRVTLLDRKGGDPEEWPEDLRVREYPQTG